MKELVTIQSKLKAPKGKEAKGQTGKVIYRYRSCEDILEAVKDLLKEVGCDLTLTDEIVLIGTRFYVKAQATLTNGAGEKVSTSAYAREPESMQTMNQSQVTGAASSYARKYALNGLFAIDDNKDMDAVVENQQATPSATTAQKKQPAANSLAAAKEQDLINQVLAIDNMTELQDFYAKAPEAFRHKESRFYQVVTNRAIELRNFG